MNIPKPVGAVLFSLCITLSQGCRKKELLEKKPVSTLFVPATLNDVQALLDNNRIINEGPVYSNISADDYYLTDPSWLGYSPVEQNVYLWAKEIYNGQGAIKDWDLQFQQVFYANISLEVLNNITVTAMNQQQWKMLKGMALFIRGNAFYNLSQVFTSAYEPATAQTDLGLPLPLQSSGTGPSIRSTLQQTYDRILSDLMEAKRLLPAAVDSAHPNRATKPAALALLARVYLGMREYALAGAYADSCLQLFNQLLDYNTVSASSPFPFRDKNPEILYQSRMSGSAMLTGLLAVGTIIDSVLYQSYDTNDLRRSLFFRLNNTDMPMIKSSYTGDVFPFNGLAVDEMYLVRAECNVRAGDLTAAANDLDTLMRKRWKTGTYVPELFSTRDSMLQHILEERRKELPFRNLRWTDIRRRNKEGAGIVLTRFIKGQMHTLPPNDLRYVLPIPPDVIALSNMPQNPR